MGALKKKKILNMHRKTCINAHFPVHVFLRELRAERIGKPWRIRLGTGFLIVVNGCLSGAALGARTIDFVVTNDTCFVSISQDGLRDKKAHASVLEILLFRFQPLRRVCLIYSDLPRCTQVLIKFE